MVLNDLVLVSWMALRAFMKVLKPQAKPLLRMSLGGLGYGADALEKSQAVNFKKFNQNLLGQTAARSCPITVGTAPDTLTTALCLQARGNRILVIINGKPSMIKSQ